MLFRYVPSRLEIKLQMKIEVAYATPAKQLIRVLEVSEDTQAEEAVRLSKISDEFPEIDLDNLKLGIFGKAISGQQRLKAGDRVEIYRPLIADPKEVRRRKAAEAKSNK